MLKLLHDEHFIYKLIPAVYVYACSLDLNKINALQMVNFVQSSLLFGSSLSSSLCFHLYNLCWTSMIPGRRLAEPIMFSFQLGSSLVQRCLCFGLLDL